MAVTVTRAQALAYRAVTQGLDRTVADARDLDVFDLGIQHTQVGTARLALAARLPDVPVGDRDPIADEDTFVVLWSVRGAPHVHRRADLAGLAAALWPLSEADATSRLGTERKALTAAGISGMAAFTTAAKALRTVVTKPLGKGDVSAAVTAALPAPYSYACRICQATHVYGGLLQQVGLFAGVRHEPDTSPPILVPLEGRRRIPTTASGTDALVRAYLHLHGPATLAEAAAYVGTTQGHLRPTWPDDLAEVVVGGRRCWIPAERLPVLQSATAAMEGVVRLLPAFDPFLQSRDRDLLVPDPAVRKQLWRILGNPGAVLADGELVATWRARVSGTRLLTLTVEPFGTLPKAVRAAVEDEAARMGTLRGVRDVAVSYA